MVPYLDSIYYLGTKLAIRMGGVFCFVLFLSRLGLKIRPRGNKRWMYIWYICHENLWDSEICFP